MLPVHFLLAFAASALALNVPRWDDGDGHGDGYGHGEGEATTMTTYETVTTCPVTETKTEQGTTYEVTQLTTSTITVTTCYGCGGGGPPTVTVPGPTEVVGTTTEVDVTYTTVCPVTETITGHGETYTTTYTTTSAVVTQVHTTLYETVVPPPVQTVATTEVDVTYTTVCPVTETITAPGHTYTTVYTTTSVVYTKVETTLYETVSSPPVTETEGAVEYKTLTSLCPVTETKTVGGSTIHITWTSTQLITTLRPTTIDVTVGSEVTVTEYPTAVVTEGNTVIQTHSQHPTTVVVPTTPATTPIYTPPPTQVSTSAPVEITNAANPNTAPAAALFAGIFGALALI